MITIHYKEGKEGSLETIKFSAGEQFVKLKRPEYVDRIVWNYEGDEELMTLGLIYEVLKFGKINVKLEMPYIPHARQDRATHFTQPFSLKVFVKMFRLIINEVYTELTVVDPHSQVAIDLLKSNKELYLNVKKQHEFSEHFVDKGYDYVVAPDKGAAEKTLQWAKELNVPMFACDKVRDPSTGYISSISTPNVDLSGKKVLIPDDIIDGGRSIIMVSESLKNKGCDFIDIFATHGIFSKGIDVFQDVNHIYTTNTLLHPYKFKDNKKLTIFDYCI